jgi:hypothetical protein
MFFLDFAGSRMLTNEGALAWELRDKLGPARVRAGTRAGPQRICLISILPNKVWHEPFINHQYFAASRLRVKPDPVESHAKP